MAAKQSTKKSKETALATKDNDAAMMAYDFGDEAGAGYDAESSKDVQIPFMVALQGLSKQMKSMDKGGVEGAKLGMLCNSVTNELCDSLLFVPSIAKRMYVEWVPRKDGGGFIGTHALDSPVVIKAKQDRQASELESGKKEWGPYPLANGNEIIETQYLYCIEVNEKFLPTGSAFCLSFTSTKLKAWRKWNTAIHSLRVPGPNDTLIQPPLYAHVVKLSTFEESNKKGDFYNLVLSAAGKDMKSSVLTLQSPGLIEAKKLADLVESGAAQVKENVQDADEGAAEGGDGKQPF